jgi:hypothetical protein
MSVPDLPSSEILESLQTAWGSPLQPTGCDHCKQVFLAEELRKGQACPLCARGKLISQPAVLRTEPPERLIAFQFGRSQVAETLSRFAKGVWLRPDDFNPTSLLERISPVYWPMWLVDSDVVGSWQAEIGYDYQVKSSLEAYGNGQWQTNEVLETRIRWEPRLGRASRHYDNIRVPAFSRHQELSALVGDYRHNAAQVYQPQQTDGALVMAPDLPPESAWPMAQVRLDQMVQEECRQAAGGQHVRNFDLQADYQPLHWTQLLMPVYLTYYRDDEGQPQLIYINGQSGAIGGRRIASQRKGWLWGAVLAVIALLAFGLSVFSFSFAAALPFLSVVGVILGFVALVSGIGAIFPVVWPWQWNRKQQNIKILQR